MGERSLGELSDRELLEACRLTPREQERLRRVESWGCGGVLVLTALAVYGAHWALRTWVGVSGGWVVLIPAGFVVGGTVFMALCGAADRRREVHWAELKRRYAGVPFEEVVWEAEREAADGGSRAGADVAVVLAGAALPHGGGWVTQVWLWGEGKGVVERRALSPSSPDRVGDVRMGRGEAALTAEECARVRELAAGECDG